MLITEKKLKLKLNKHVITQLNKKTKKTKKIKTKRKKEDLEHIPQKSKAFWLDFNCSP